MNKSIKEHKISYSTYVPIILGVLAGCLCFFIMMLYNPDAFRKYGLEDYKISVLLDLPVFYLAIYVLKKRVGQLLFFIILAILFSYSIAATCYCFFFGIYYGIVVCNLFVKFGINGLVYGEACFFPHYLIYFLTIYLVGRWFYAESTAIYSHTNVNKLQKLFKYFVIFFAIIIAIIWEIKFQKNILNYFYQYLV